MRELIHDSWTDYTQIFRDIPALISCIPFIIGSFVPILVVAFAIDHGGLLGRQRKTPELRRSVVYLGFTFLVSLTFFILGALNAGLGFFIAVIFMDIILVSIPVMLSIFPILFVMGGFSRLWTENKYVAGLLVASCIVGILGLVVTDDTRYAWCLAPLLYIGAKLFIEETP